MRQLGILGMAALAALIVGFLTRRMMIPSAVHYIAYRPPDHPQQMKETNPPDSDQPQGAANGAAASNAKSNADAQGSSENLTPNDRRELDAIIKRKAK
jgi:hypothetical protein